MHDMKMIRALCVAAFAAAGAHTASVAQELVMKDYEFKPGEGYAYVFATKRSLSVIYLPTLKAYGNVRQAWFSRYMPEPSVLAGVTYDRAVEQTEFDCASERMRVVSVALYNGSKQVKTELATSEWRPVVPSTLGAENMRAACNPLSLASDANLDVLIAGYRRYLEKSGTNRERTATAP